MPIRLPKKSPPEPPPHMMCVCVWAKKNRETAWKQASSKWDGPKCDSPAALRLQASMNASTQILGEGLNGCREIVFAVQLMARDWFCWNVPLSKKTHPSAVMHTDRLPRSLPWCWATSLVNVLNNCSLIQEIERSNCIFRIHSFLVVSWLFLSLTHSWSVGHKHHL